MAFAAAFWGGRRLLRRPAFADLRKLVMDDMLLAGVCGVIVGGRIGYVLFYKAAFYADSPAEIFRIWDGGMSFHGGLLGVIIALFFYARKNGFLFLRVVDFAAVLTPFGLGLGRIGNFINGELPGRIASADLPWAMIFPGDAVARHPSPLYQAILEGGVLFAAMLFFAARRRPPGFLSGVFLIGYALARMFSELFREPDSHLGFVIGNLSMGQILSFPMLLGGIALLTMNRWIPVLQERRKRKRKKANAERDSESVPESSADESKTDSNSESISESESDSISDSDSGSDSEHDSDSQTVAAEVLDHDSDSESDLNSDIDSGSDSDSDSDVDSDSDSKSDSDSDSIANDSDDGAIDSDNIKSSATKSLPWWKRMFGDSKTEVAETQPRRRSRRESRRNKKKKRRR